MMQPDDKEYLLRLLFLGDSFSHSAWMVIYQDMRNQGKQITTDLSIKRFVVLADESGQRHDYCLSPKAKAWIKGL